MWSFVGGIPVQTSDAALLLWDYLKKVRFYTEENRAVLTLLDAHCETFLVRDKKNVPPTRKTPRRGRRLRTRRMSPPLRRRMASRPSGVVWQSHKFESALNLIPRQGSKAKAGAPTLEGGNAFGYVVANHTKTGILGLLNR